MEPTRIPSRTTLILGLTVGITAASTAAIFIRFAQSEAVPSIVIAAARLTIASLILAPIALTLFLPHLRKLTNAEKVLALLSGFFLALHFATWITSLEFTSVASSVVLVTTTPLWVAVLSPFILREKIGRGIIFGMVLALIGGFIIGLSDTCIFHEGTFTCQEFNLFFTGSAFKGDFLALTGAWMAAGYILVGRKLRNKLPLVPYIFIVYGVAALILIVIMLGMGETPLGFPPVAYLWFFLLAVFPQLVGHTSFNWALRYLPASFVSVVLLGEPIGSSILAYVIFNERPSMIMIGGAIFILVGIWISASSSDSL